MRALIIGALAVSVAGCSCRLPPQASIEGCTDANGFACFDRTAASQPIEPAPASFKTDSATIEIRSAVAKVTEKPSSPSSLKRRPPAGKAAADFDITRAKIAASHPTGGTVANSNTRTIQEPLAAATAIAEGTTVGAAVSAPEPKANDKDLTNHSETAQRGDAEKTALGSSNQPPTGGAQNQPVDTAWVVSETTSPVDYSPLITAVIHSTSSVKDAPNTLAVRCLGLRTELLLRTEGAWRAARASEVQVDYQINDQPFVRLQWTVSADGKTASYKDDAVGLLRSLPEGAQLKISVLDRQGSGRQTTFQLTGLDSVRKKIGSACNWPSTTDKMSSGKR